MNSYQLQRNGYGSAFNQIIIQNDLLHKVAKTLYGKQKLEKEIAFYRFCSRLRNNLPLPKIIDIDDICITMKYYSTYNPLYKIYWYSNKEKQLEFQKQIHILLDQFHNVSSISITKEVLHRDLFEEGVYKIQSRYKDIETLLEKFHILTVNSIEILSFETLVKYIQEKLSVFEKDIPLNYTLIHGDCQFNNILYSSSENKFLFIDPRGYFGKTDIFGLPHYDHAKILFALSGYDIFDSLTVETLDIQNKNLILPPIPFDLQILQSISLETILMVSIWLGNAHCFQKNPQKAALSHFYARYVGTLVYMSDKSLIK